MIRSVLAATLAGGFGAAVGPGFREAARDALLTYPDPIAVIAVGLVAGLIWSLIMPCRDLPPSGCAYAPPARDAAGRYRKR